MASFNIFSVLLIFAVMALTPLSHGRAEAQSPFEIYKTQVHAITKVRCGICHGQSQRPLHSVSDPSLAYPVAKTLVSFKDPESSRLWIRSQNGHCGIPERCGYKDAALLSGLKNWINAENALNKQTAADASSTTSGTDAFTSWAELDASIKDNEIKQLSFTGPSGESFTLSYTLKPGGVFYFYHPEFSIVPQDIAFSGILLDSKDLDFRSQNFDESSYILRPTKSSVVLTKQGYVMAVKPEAKSKYSVRLILNDYQSQLSADKIIDLRNAGYQRPKSQVINAANAIQISSGGSHTCALFEDSSIKCWGSNEQGQLALGDNPDLRDRDFVGGGPGDLSKLKPLFPNQKALQVSSGGSHTCALFEDKTTKCWGVNSSADLALGDNDDLKDRGTVGDQPSDLQKLQPLIFIEKP